MSLNNKIEEIKNKALNMIKDAANSGNTEEVIIKTKILEEVKKIELSFELTLNSLVKKLDNDTLENEHELSTSKVIVSSDKYFSKKEKGNYRRDRFLRMLQNRGIKLIKEKGVIYKTINGSQIGIASASEDKKRKNYWFLGLPNQAYATIVLLCENLNGQIYNFILPKTVYKQFENKISRDNSNEQLKFNISKKNDDFKMTIPGIQPFLINEYIDNYSSFYNL